MIAWYRGLTAREQGLLAVMAVLALGVVIWLGVVRPLSTARDRAETRLTRAVADAQMIAAAGAELSALAPKAVASGPIEPIVREAAAAAGLSLAQAQPAANGDLRVTLDAAASTAVFPWLTRLAREQGVVARHLTVLKNPDGGLAVDVVFGRLN